MPLGLSSLTFKLKQSIFNVLIPVGELRIFSEYFDLRAADFFIYSLSPSHSFHLTFIHIFALTLLYGLARHESSIAQWLVRPTGTCNVMGSIPVGELRILIGSKPFTI